MVDAEGIRQSLKLSTYISLGFILGLVVCRLGTIIVERVLTLRVKQMQSSGRGW